MHAQIVLFDGFDPLDAIAPFEVLVAGSDMVGGELDVALVSAEGPREVVSGSRGLTLRATTGLDPGKPGYVIVPGASGPIEGDPDAGVQTIPVLLARFGETAAVPLMRRALDHPDVTVATVCGGSLALAMAGLLDGRRATTHHLGVDVLEAVRRNSSSETACRSVLLAKKPNWTTCSRGSNRTRTAPSRSPTSPRTRR